MSFESLLSLHGEDVAIFNDMIVAVEDLRNVEFTLIIVDNSAHSMKVNKRSREKREANRDRVGGQANSGCDGAVPSTPMTSSMNTSFHSFPLPRVTGSRSSLKVLIPVPDYVYAQILPKDKMKSVTFAVTPVLFNIGINEHATLAGKFGENGPQV